jgi:hypothetical protein
MRQQVKLASDEARFGFKTPHVCVSSTISRIIRTSGI